MLILLAICFKMSGIFFSQRAKANQLIQSAHKIIAVRGYLQEHAFILLQLSGKSYRLANRKTIFKKEQEKENEQKTRK